MNELSKAQQKYLRKLSHKHKPLFQLGKLGLTETFIEQVDTALEKRELVKFHILQNSDEDLEEVAETVATAVNAVIVQTIGKTVILYRPSSKEKYQEISKEVADLK